MDLQRVLEKCGNFGPYQILLLGLYGYTNIVSSLHYFSQTLISFTPSHSCSPPKDFIPGNKTSLLACSIIQYDEDLSPSRDYKCSSWDFERESNYESVTTELEWVCDDAYKLAVGQSFFFIGSALGSIFFGYLADRIGRLPACVLSTLTGASGDFFTSFVGSLPWFSFTRFISGLSMDTQYVLMYILVFEYLSPQHRTFGLNIILGVFYSIGLMISPWMAIWLGNWRSYLWAASLPALGMLLFPVFLHESVEWLLTKGKFDKAVNNLKSVAMFNGRQVDDSVFDEFIKHYREKMNSATKKSSDTFMGMLRTPRLRKFTIILLIKSMIITIAFDILSRNVEGVGISPFHLFSYSGFVVLPGGLTIILFQNKIGRKGMACASLFVGAFITAATGYLVGTLDPANYSVLLGVMVCLARFGAVVAYDAEAQYAAEIIPTSVRGRGVANIHVVGNAFAFFSSYIIYLGTFYKPLPSLLISFLLIIGGCLCLALPETLHKQLPQTLEEGEMFAKGEKWYFFPCFSRKLQSKKSEAQLEAAS
ncbi:organic cation transporter protein-like [Drosophila subpulchrella]|uniref:organic cation transporter protein-like n=1 Tax=Drosophila subpulchrella TaxID=1486046 RepID=UPI0018A175AF|nr:organic cation transporter protein-like [Drosophila subpulchrella]